MCKHEYLITKVWKWVMKAIKTIWFYISFSLVIFILLYGISAFSNGYNISTKPSWIITNIDDQLDGKLDSVEETQDTTKVPKTFGNIFLLGTLIITLAALFIAENTLKQHKQLQETELLFELLKEWGSEKMQAARASLSLKYLMKVKIGNNDFKDFKKSIKESLKKSEHNKKYEEHIRSILNISSKQDAESRLTNLTPQEESVINFFEKIGFLIEEEDLNKDDVWEAFITKMEPYYYKIGHPFIRKKRERYSYGYYHYYKSLIDTLCTEKFYKTKRDKYGENNTKNKRPEILNKHANFYSFKSPPMKENGEEKILDKCMFLAFSEIRYLTGENIRENYNK